MIKNIISQYYDGTNHNLLAQDILYQMFDQKGMSDEEIDDQEAGKKNATKKDTTMNLNQILYGPPGTGKTYHTIDRAVKIIEPEFYNNNRDNREELKMKFEECKDAGQIEFVAFHQSYGYEEFVEGIKASTDNGTVQYDIESGIFKNISEKALENLNNSKRNTTIQYQKLISDYANYVEQLIEQEEEINIPHSSFHIVGIKRDGNDIPKSFLVGKDGPTQSLSRKIITRDIEKFFNGDIKSYQDIKPTYESASTYHGNAIYYYELLNFIKSFYDKNRDNYTQDKIKKQNYILIIDEINRGNISKIFGELITLIEPSKRIGEDEEIQLKLPYSNEVFGVPNNLYIIGTMNTSDRSIAQIDTALRRRFEFVKMMPEYKILDDAVIEADGYKIKVKKILYAINDRIEYIYDREHQIGHSYFLPLIKESTKKRLDAIFRVNIIPLLAEYFYGDWADIRFILNNDFVAEKPLSKYIANSTRKGKKVYEINPKFTTEEYIKIYKSGEHETSSD